MGKITLMLPQTMLHLFFLWPSFTAEEESWNTVLLNSVKYMKLKKKKSLWGNDFSDIIITYRENPLKPYY